MTISDPAASVLVLRMKEGLAARANASNALGMAAYMRQRFVFLGVQTPARRLATLPHIRSFRGDLLPAAQILWAEPEREYQYAACDLLRRQMHRLGPEHLRALEELVAAKSWWDTVDTLAVVIGDVVRRHPHLASRMDDLIVADDFWLRRVAVLHQLAWKDGTDEARLFRYCLQCASEKEFFIQKAIGWALRQYARVAPAAVKAFLSANGDKLAALSRREAAKHLA